MVSPKIGNKAFNDVFAKKKKRMEWYSRASNKRPWIALEKTDASKLLLVASYFAAIENLQNQKQATITWEIAS